MEKEIKENIKNNLFQNITDYDLNQINMDEIINIYEELINETNIEYKEKILSLAKDKEKINNNLNKKDFI